MDIRPYLSSDREACLAVFDANTPKFFHSSERAGYEQFLHAPDCPYFVLEVDTGIIACGGYDTRSEIASLVWGMVHPDLHGQGIGRYLLLFRLREIGRAGTFPAVQVETSQLVAGFFEKQGFRVTGRVENGWAPGYDRVQLVKKLTVCA